MGGGGGGGSTQFKAQGAPPGFDYQSGMGLNQLAIGGDISSYALSDLDFANRYPALQNAYNQWQSNLGQQTGAVGAGTAGQQAIMSGLANTIAGRQGVTNTADIQGIRNAAQTVNQAVQPMYNLGSTQAGLAQPLIGMGQQQAGLGGQIAGLGGQLAGSAQIPYQLGQQLLQQPMDPQVQQQMMLAGLGSSAGALGAASLGQGMAGQAAAARQLGLNTIQYGMQRRGEAMGDINQYASMLGQAGQLQGLGAQTIGAGGQTIGLGGQQLQGAGQLYQGGANVGSLGGQLYGQAQGATEQMAMDTAQMANIYGNLQNQQAQNLMLNMQTAGQLFQKRPFGLGGTNLAQTELGQAGAYNSFQQANYATMNGIAFNQAQINAQQQQLAAQQQAGMMSAGVGAAGAVASAAAAAAAISCWVARRCYGADNPRWVMFRSWLYSKRCPWLLRALYLKFGRWVAENILRSSRAERLRGLIRLAMDRAIYDRVLIAEFFRASTI
jgi:hypothetical protein